MHPAGKYSASSSSRRMAFKRWWNILCNAICPPRWIAFYEPSSFFRASRTAINGFLSSKEDLHRNARLFPPLLSFVGIAKVCRSRASVTMWWRFISKSCDRHDSVTGSSGPTTLSLSLLMLPVEHRQATPGIRMNDPLFLSVNYRGNSGKFYILHFK